jgi:hypothetical protein
MTLVEVGRHNSSPIHLRSTSDTLVALRPHCHFRKIVNLHKTIVLLARRNDSIPPLQKKVKRIAGNSVTHVRPEIQ